MNLVRFPSKKKNLLILSDLSNAGLNLSDQRQFPWDHPKISEYLRKKFRKGKVTKLDCVVNQATLNATASAFLFRHRSHEITFLGYVYLCRLQFHGSVILPKEVLSLNFDFLWFSWYTI